MVSDFFVFVLIRFSKATLSTIEPLVIGFVSWTGFLVSMRIISQQFETPGMAVIFIIIPFVSFLVCFYYAIFKFFKTLLVGEKC